MSHGYSSLNYRQLRGKNCTGYKGYKCSARGRRQTAELSNDLALFSPSASRRSSATPSSFKLCPNLDRYISNCVVEVDMLSPILSLSVCLNLSIYLGLFFTHTRFFFHFNYNKLIIITYCMTQFSFFMFSSRSGNRSLSNL